VSFLQIDFHVLPRRRVARHANVRMTNHVYLLMTPT